jgi:hypothetical protein
MWEIKLPARKIGSIQADILRVYACYPWLLLNESVDFQDTLYMQYVGMMEVSPFQ